MVAWVMWRCILVLACVLSAALAAAQERAEQDDARRDLYGDPLPPHALRRLGTVRFRQEYVEDMAFTPDGQALVVRSTDQVVLWDVKTGKRLRVFHASKAQEPRSFGLSRDGRLVAFAQGGKSVVVCELATGTERFRKEVRLQAPTGVISPDGSLVAASARGGTLLWDVATGEERGSLPGTFDLQFSPDNKWLAARVRGDAVNREDRIVLFDAKTLRDECSVRLLKVTVSEPSISGFRFTPDGKYLLVSWFGEGILIYDVKRQKVARHVDADAQLVAVSADGQMLAAAKNRTVMLVSIATGKELRRWQVEDRFLARTGGAFAPDGKTLALGFECGIQLWDPTTGKRIDPFRGPVHIPQYLAVADDGKTIAVLYGRHGGQFLQLLDTETLQEKGRLDAEPFTLEHLAFSPDGRLLAVTDWPIVDRNQHLRQVRVVVVATGKEVTPAQKILGAFSHWQSNSSVVVVAGPIIGPAEWVAVDVTDGKPRERRPVPTDAALLHHFLAATARAPRRMVVVSDRRSRPPDGRERAFVAERPSGKRLRELEANGRLDSLSRQGQFSPDERLLAATDFDRSVSFWEAATGRVRFDIKGQKPTDFWHASFSPDSRLIVLRGEAKYQLLDALTFEPRLEFVPSTYYGSSLAISADGRVLVTGDTSALLVWDLPAALRARQTSAEPLSAARLGELWAELESLDARAGHRALVALARRPGEATALIRSRLPAAAPEEETFKKLVRALDDAAFRTREAASQAIAKMGGSAGGLIHQALKDPPSLEARARLLALADKLKVTEGERVRWLRCVELLERIGTPDARAAVEAVRNIFDPEVSSDAERSIDRLKSAAQRAGS